ncbi:MAG: phosphoenolpyruvate--protein phosphotransferase [Anaerolineaceae bacterium]|nr:phosphoenolpyruvate--protein phosphotransferase [Anaerolineaceae bacterium]
MGKTFQGLPASSGIAIGPIWKYIPQTINISRHLVADRQIEWKRFEDSRSRAEEELDVLYHRALEMTGDEEAAIFEAHKMLLNDPELASAIHKTIMDEGMNAEAAVHDSVENYAAMLLAMDNEYFRERATDIRDVGNRLIRCLQGIDCEAGEQPQQPVIILAEDLTPSDTIQFEKDMILGFCTIKGGPTSHTAILSKSLGKPAIVSLQADFDEIEQDLTAILDGSKGEFILAPSEKVLQKAKESQEVISLIKDDQLKRAHQPAITTDGTQLEIVANIGSAEDARQAIDSGAEGVGLLRTEFLYLDRDSMPSEEEQIQTYREIFEIMSGKPIVIRTLDIGGDKEVSFLGTQHEPNPFLGWRAIRMIDERPEILSDQFRAILQADPNADLRIMLPLVSCIDEIIKARGIYDQSVAELKQENKAFTQKVQFGIMVEVPSAAILAEELAEIVDFFSIGTNDLTQYSLAVDRTNERVAHLASPFNPAVIRLISMTIQAAHKKGKWVGLCGEMAGDPLATKLLLGLGLDEFSMSAPCIPEIKHLIRQCSFSECQEIAQKALKCASTDQILDLLNQ